MNILQTQTEQQILSYWNLINTGFNYRTGQLIAAATTYNIGDVVRYVSSTYVQLKDRQVNVTPGTDGTVWQLIAQGDTGAVLSTRGDLFTRRFSNRKITNRCSWFSFNYRWYRP
jgi:hypothetical protein